jgi:1,4-dihydroxy-2-naphthoate octaprenyltransferase
MISMSASRKALGTIWLAGFFIPLLLLIVMTNNGSLQDTTAAWGWFLPTMLPTVSLIVAVFVADAINPGARDRRAGRATRASRVSRFFFVMACLFSVVYTGLVLLVALEMPRTTSPAKLTDLLKNSNIYLGPIQGLVTAVLGVFFVNRGKEREGD